MRTRTLAPILLACASFLASPAARAEDAARAEAGRKVLAAFAAPSEKHAYSVGVELYVGGGLLGEGAFSATPETKEGQALWRTTESVRVGSGPAPQLVSELRGLVGADLRLVEEVREKKGAGEAATTRAVRTEKGVRLTHSAGDRTEEKDLDAPAGTVSGGLATLILFLRQVPAEPAEYDVMVWNGDARAVQRRTISVKGVGRLKDERLGLDVEALWAVSTGGTRLIEIYADPKDRAFLGLRSADQNLWVTRKGLVTPKDAGAAPDLSKPAESARGVGAKLALGLLTGSVAAIDASFHWPSLIAAAQEKGGDIDEATLRTLTLASFKPSMQTLDLTTAWGIVKRALDGAEEKPLEDGTVHVRLGPPMEKVSYTARRIEGAGWRITGMETADGDGAK